MEDFPNWPLSQPMFLSQVSIKGCFWNTKSLRVSIVGVAKTRWSSLSSSFLSRKKGIGTIKEDNGASVGSI